MCFEYSLLVHIFLAQRTEMFLILLCAHKYIVIIIYYHYSKVSSKHSRIDLKCLKENCVTKFQDHLVNYNPLNLSIILAASTATVHYLTLFLFFFFFFFFCGWFSYLQIIIHQQNLELTKMWREEMCHFIHSEHHPGSMNSTSSQTVCGIKNSMKYQNICTSNYYK